MAAKSPEHTKLALADLVDNPRNPRRHPAAQLDKIVASIRRFGQPRPILVRAANKMIIAGHGLKQALERAGEAQADVILWNVDQETADAFMLADNQHALNGRDDADAIAKLLAEVAKDDFESLGFDEGQALKLLEEGEEIPVHEVETGAVRDRFWISVRGPLKHQAQALQAMQAAMKGLDVSVELGTVSDAS
jgi:ParB-like chromosome segregation protein Spo0J